MIKKTTLILAMLIALTSYSQVQVSVNVGYAIGSAEVKLGERTTTSKTENLYGSYGEGLSFQLRGSYFFKNNLGVDLGFAYLHGDDQQVREADIPNYRTSSAVGRGRAFGVTPSLIYKFTNNFYGRVGALLKIGGKTEAVVSDKNYYAVAPSADNPVGVTVSSAFGLPDGAYTHTEYKEDYHGKLPLGFIGALGYRFDLNDNFGFFAEVEYLGISVKRKESKLTEFNTDVVLADGTVAVQSLYSMDNLPEGYFLETTYEDSLSNSNTDLSKKLGQSVPYSSFGINFGITYTFSKSKKK